MRRPARAAPRVRACAAALAAMLGMAAAAPAARADNGGPGYSWQTVVQGPMLSVRGARMLSPALRPAAMPALATGKVRSVRWQYTFSGVPPRDLQAYLCNTSRCVMLPAAQGLTEAFRGDPAAQEFTFAFLAPGRGALAPALQGRANQVIVDYR